MSILADLPEDVSVRAATAALGMSRATLYRARASAASTDEPTEPSSRRRPVPSPPRRLDDAERAAVI